MRFAAQRSRQEVAPRSLDVCVVGAGLSGLVTIKELLDEGHRVTCFEHEAQAGGNFNYPTGAAYDTMYLTTSQYFTAFSSFPPPLDQTPRHWSRREYAQYLHDFSMEFQLLRHIRFGIEVVTVRRVQDGSSEKFLVEHRDSKTGLSTRTAFDAHRHLHGTTLGQDAAGPEPSGRGQISRPDRVRDVVQVPGARTAESTSCASASARRPPTSPARSRTWPPLAGRPFVTTLWC